jgi:hypothetical protein
MLALASVIVLLCVAVMFLIAGDQVDKQLDDRAAEIERSIDADLNKIREDVRRELEAQGTPAPVPTPTPFETPTPEPSPTETETPSPEPTPGTDGGPTPTPTIGP